MRRANIRSASTDGLRHASDVPRHGLYLIRLPMFLREFDASNILMTVKGLVGKGRGIDKVGKSCFDG